jgi:hypothetical protein
MTVGVERRPQVATVGEIVGESVVGCIVGSTIGEIVGFPVDT